MKPQAFIPLYVRALRLPFVSASVLPFIFGSLITQEPIRLLPFMLGFFCVLGMHLGANLINDYADSKYGTDWKDHKFYEFFGGSKLIQEGVLPEKFYLTHALFYFGLSFVCVCLLALILQNGQIFGFFLFILFLGFSYSHKPLALSYHRLGEVIIFALFGPAVVMGGYFIQTQVFLSWKSFLLSIPCGLLTTAILFSNEIPDHNTDVQSQKRNWSDIWGISNAYVLYYILTIVPLFLIALCIRWRYLNYFALLSFSVIFLIIAAARVMKNNYTDKDNLVRSSKLTILIQTVVSLILIIGAL